MLKVGGGGRQKILPCLEGGAQKVLALQCSLFVAPPPPLSVTYDRSPSP